MNNFYKLLLITVFTISFSMASFANPYFETVFNNQKFELIIKTVLKGTDREEFLLAIDKQTQKQTQLFQAKYISTSADDSRPWFHMRDGGMLYFTFTKYSKQGGKDRMYGVFGVNLDTLELDPGVKFQEETSAVGVAEGKLYVKQKKNVSVVDMQEKPRKVVDTQSFSDEPKVYFAGNTILFLSGKNIFKYNPTNKTRFKYPFEDAHLITNLKFDASRGYATYINKFVSFDISDGKVRWIETFDSFNAGLFNPPKTFIHNGSAYLIQKGETTSYCEDDLDICHGNGRVLVIDLNAEKLSKTLSVLNHPEDIQFYPRKSEAIISYSEDGTSGDMETVINLSDHSMKHRKKQ